MRLLRRLAATLGLVVALYLLASVALPLIPGPRADVPRGQGVTIGLLPGPIHYDLLLPLTPETRQRFAFSRPAGVAVDDPAMEWLILGHGGRAFYTTVGEYRDVSLRALWLGVTGDASVTRLDVAGPVRDDIGIRWLEIGPEQLAALIEAALASDPEPAAISGPGLTARDVFFETPGGSDIFRTCNAWLGATLRAAGIDFGLWTPATWSVALSLWRFQ